MPSTKKGNGRKSSKKKGNKRSSRNSGAVPSQASTTSAASALLRVRALDAATPPDMSGFERHNPIHPDDFPTIYQRYKDATKHFFAYMEKQARAMCVHPETTEMSGNALMIIADHMDDEGCTIDPLILKDLKLAILIRSRVVKYMYGGGIWDINIF